MTVKGLSADVEGGFVVEYYVGRLLDDKFDHLAIFQSGGG